MGAGQIMIMTSPHVRWADSYADGELSIHGLEPFILGCPNTSMITACLIVPWEGMRMSYPDQIGKV